MKIDRIVTRPIEYNVRTYYVVVEGNRRIAAIKTNLLGFSITKGRSALECLLTFRYWFKCWGAKPHVVVTDDGVWYSVLGRLGLKRLIISGNVRSYIERFNATLKSYRWFHSVLHCTCRLRTVHGSAQLSGFLTLFLFHSTFLRPHQSLRRPPLSSFFPSR